MIIASAAGTLYTVTLGVVLVFGWVALWAIWHFAFRNAPRDGSDPPYIVAPPAGDQDEAGPPLTDAMPDSIAASRASMPAGPSDGR